MRFFDDTTFPKLKEGIIHIKVHLQDWTEAKQLSDSWGMALQGMRHPSLSALSLRLELHVDANCDGVASYWVSKLIPNWPFNYLPDPQRLANRIVKFGGNTCDYDFFVTLQSANPLVHDNFATSSTIYTYLVQQEIFKLQHGDTASTSHKGLWF